MSSTNRPFTIGAAAAAIVVVAALGIALLSRGGSEGDRQSATSPDAAETTSDTTDEAAAPSDEAAAPSDEAVAPAGGDIAAGETQTGQTRVEASSAGPLSVLQERLDGTRVAGEDAQRFCFSGTGVLIVPASQIAPDEAVFEMYISDGGRMDYLGVQNQSLTIAGAVIGNASGVFDEEDPNGYNGLSRSLPPVQMKLTDSSLTIGSESTLNLTPCEGEITDVLGVAADGVAFEVDGQAAEPEVAPLPQDEVISSAGIGPIRVGILLSELSAELGVPVEFDTLGPKQAGECGFVTTNLDTSLWILVEAVGPDDAVIRRVTALSDRFPTPSGIRVGMGEQQVLDTFVDRLDVRPHTYVQPGNYLTFLTSDPNDPNTVEFVTEYGLVAMIHAGEKDWVSFVEGCA